MGAKEERQEAEESGGGLWGYLVFASEKFGGRGGRLKGPRATGLPLKGPSHAHRFPCWGKL